MPLRQREDIIPQQRRQQLYEHACGVVVKREPTIRLLPACQREWHSPQDSAVIEAQRMATSVWRLTAGRPALDGRNSTIGRLDFVLQVLPSVHT